MSIPSREPAPAGAPHGPGHAPGHSSHARHWRTLSLAALGVVFGDIGTSPLYAMRECFHGPHAIAASPENVLGVLSLIVWTLFIVISLKYLVFILRADNDGEGGILALSVLVSHVKPRHYLMMLGLFGAALLYADGMITPAISVLSAVEGVQLAAPRLEPFVVPITIGILLGLFLMQSRGTAKVGALFGPVTLLWFVVIAVLGIISLAKTPAVLAALSPVPGVRFFMINGWHGFLVMGAVFLVATGGEALYADIGHFGIRPIRLVWFSVVLPALLLNYLGQGALLLRLPEAAADLFFAMAPSWALFPLILLASAAAVIASQALITGAFSLTMQAVQLGYMPRVTIRHTSADAMGQIYLPVVNWGLMVSCIALVVGFGSSSNLSAAYGISIASTMALTTILFFVIARYRWKWPAVVAIGVSGLFLVIDLAFFSANAVKILNGGWLPLLVAGGIFTLMTTWRRGRTMLVQRLKDSALPLDQLLESIRDHSPVRVAGTAFFMVGNPSGTPPALLHNLKHNKVLHERVVVLHVRTVESPYVPAEERSTVEPLELGFWRISIRFGFMDDPNVPEALQALAGEEFPYLPLRSSFFLGRETILPTGRSGLSGWRESLFGWMSQNARSATSFFCLPPGSVVELGSQVKM